MVNKDASNVMADLLNRVQLREFHFDSQAIRLCVPEEAFIQHWYESALRSGFPVSFPYWAKVWPAAIGLCHFLTARPDLIRDAFVLEIAAGLGLPGLLAATRCREVLCTDKEAPAMQLVDASIAENGLVNARTAVLDWSRLPSGLTPDVLLLSDINYEPAVFEELYAMIIHFLGRGTRILISTPQRLMARPFMLQLLPFTIEQTSLTVQEGDTPVEVSVLVLQSARPYQP